jgi:hypothetical protein
MVWQAYAVARQSVCPIGHTAVSPNFVGRVYETIQIAAWRRRSLSPDPGVPPQEHSPGSQKAPPTVHRSTSGAFPFLGSCPRGRLSSRDSEIEQAIERAVLDTTLQANLDAAIDELRTGRKPTLMELSEGDADPQPLPVPFAVARALRRSRAL